MRERKGERINIIILTIIRGLSYSTNKNKEALSVKLTQRNKTNLIKIYDLVQK